MKKRSVGMLLFLAVFMIAVSMSGSEKKKDVEEYPFFGTWRIEKVAVISEMYTGTTLDGVSEEDLYDSEDFLGYELEYTPQYFRIGDEKYKVSEYVVSYESVDGFNNGGKFWPYLYTFIEKEEIKINNMEDYTPETLLMQFDVNFTGQVSYGQYNFIPIGTRCVLLNDDTMIVGTWGKTLLARRVESNNTGTPEELEDICAESSTETENEKARRAYYDVCLEGAESEYLAEEEKERMQYFLPIGGEDMYFIIKDMDHDGIDELLIGGENIGGISEISRYTYDMLCTKVYFIFSYEDGKVKVPVIDVNDYDGGSFALENGHFGTKYWSSLYELPEESKYYGNEEIFASGTMFQIWEDYHCKNGRMTYQAVRCSSEEGWIADEYFVNEELVSEEEWKASIEENIISHIVPEDEIYSLREENLKSVLLDKAMIR